MRNLSVVRTLFTVVLCTLVAASMTAAGAFTARGADRIDAFLGLWEGVDSMDGSFVRLSVSDVDDDGIIEVTQAETFFSVCHRMGANFSLGRGVEVGTGTVARNKDALDVDIQLVCIDDDNVRHPQDLEAVEYQLASRGRNLITPVFPQSEPIVLHRVAQ